MQFAGSVRDAEQPAKSVRVLASGLTYGRF